MLNWIWAVLILSAVSVAAVNDARGGFACETLSAEQLLEAKLSAPRTCMQLVSAGALDGAKSAVELLIGLVGAMILFLGLVRIASDAGLLRVIVRALLPILRRVFPEVPPDHPAMGAMLMNLSSNMLGLGNAATPFGVKAMVELDRLNPHPGVATNAMALFLAINSASIVLMPPTGTAAIRFAAGSQMPLAIWIPTLLATSVSLVVAVTAVLLLQRMPFFAFRPLEGGPAERPAPPADLPNPPLPGSAPAASAGNRWARAMLLAMLAAIAGAFVWRMVTAAQSGSLDAVLKDVANSWVLPLLMFALVAYGVSAGVRVYEIAIEGSKEALTVATRIAPYLVMILSAIAMFRASGALAFVIETLRPVTSALGVPPEVLPMMLLRPLSGSGAFAVMAETVNTYGPDSYVGLLVSTLQGSTETTFYVLAVYLGAVGVRNARHILPACLIGDFAGYVGAVVACRIFFGG